MGDVKKIRCAPACLLDPEKLEPIVFDPVHNTYRKLGEIAGHAFRDGMQLK